MTLFHGENAIKRGDGGAARNISPQIQGGCHRYREK
jgi:hypothetical protein